MDVQQREWARRVGAAWELVFGNQSPCELYVYIYIYTHLLCLYIIYIYNIVYINLYMKQLIPKQKASTFLVWLEAFAWFRVHPWTLTAGSLEKPVTGPFKYAPCLSFVRFLGCTPSKISTSPFCSFKMRQKTENSMQSWVCYTQKRWSN